MANKNIDKWEHMLLQNPRVKMVKSKLTEMGVPQEVKLVYLLGAGAGLTLMIVALMSGLRALTQIVGFAYPTWASIKAIGSEDKDDDTFWLTYWIVYSSISVVESISDIFLFWIPMYEWIKMAFFIFMWHPKTEGARKIYQIVFQPLIGYMEMAENSSKSVYSQAQSYAKRTD